MIVDEHVNKKIMLKIMIGLTGLSFLIIASYGGFTYIGIKQYIQQTEYSTSNQLLAAKAARSAREAKKKEPVYITLPGAKQIRALVDDYSSPSSIWALANKTHVLPIDYIPNSLKIPNVSTRTDKSNDERSVRSELETPLIDMFAAANAYSYQLMIGSGYRSAALQKIYYDSLASSVGETAANQAIALPGQSEHQTGLAVDISTISRNCYLDNCFADTSDGKWLVENSYKFGFILRYPEDKVAITGYQYESWHFRYVGIDLATALHDSKLTLDEAWPYLEKAEITLKNNGAL